MQQAEDFRAESEALFALLEQQNADTFDEPTLFKNWTTNAVLQHLYVWNMMAGLQITDETELLNRIIADRSVIVIEHDMKFVEDIATRVTVLHQGKVLSEGSMAHVQADPQVVEVYLGH